MVSWLFYFKDIQNMKLDKSQALLLSKLLFNYRFNFRDEVDHLTEIQGLQAQLDAFLTGCSVDDDDECDDDDDECDDDDEDPEDDDDDEGEENVPPPQASQRVSAVALHDMAPPLQISTGELEFECDDEDNVDVLVNGYAEVHNATFVRRKSDTFEAWADGHWHSWNLVKVPKLWKKSFAVDIVYKVEAP
jgi:hypothetical protein